MTLTRDLIRKASGSVLDAVAARSAFGGAHRILLAHTAMSCRALLDSPDLYTDQQLAEFVTNAGHADNFKAQEPAEARMAGHLLDVMGELAMDVLASRAPAGGRPC